MRVKMLLLVASCALGTADAQRVGTPTDELTNLSTDELFQIQVTSVGRKAQQLSKAPAAVFVLTADDIRRSGANSIPEALQWVPGLAVLKIDGRSWAISARGSTRLWADKILVMIDGRSLYTPLFSGVIWDAVDVPMEDIEQIEIVRGPGAVMWGPNAVNGVINIITKPARSTTGALLSVASGNELHGSILARWGAAPNDKVAYRVWAKFEDRDPGFSSPGYFHFDGNFPIVDPTPVKDQVTQSARLGFRVGLQPSEKDHFLFTGDVYKMGDQGTVGYPVLLPNVVDIMRSHTGYMGGYIQALWTRSSSPGNEQNLQFTYSRDDINYPFIGGTLNNLNLNYEKRRQTSDRNEIYWGAGFQQYWDSTQGERFGSFDPPDSVYRIGDVVFRDEFQLIPDRLMVSAGIRVDYTSSTHFEYQPSFRLLYTPTPRQSVWFALSRAVRVPSRVDRDVVADGGQVMLPGIPFPVSVQEFGNKAMLSERERSVEAGYRIQSGQRWSLDTSVFLSFYDRLRVLQYPDQPDVRFVDGIPTLHMSLTEQSRGTGRSYGSETWANIQINPKWRLIPSYTYLNEKEWLPTPATSYAWLMQSSDSRHQGIVRSQHDLTRNLQVDFMARARSRNLTFNLPGVVLADARIGWRPNHNTEVSFSVQNLTNRTVLETYSEGPFVAIPTRRTFVFRWTQKF